MPEQPKRCFVGHELHHWPNFDLLIVDSALPDQNRTENFVIVGKVTLTGVVRTVKGVLPIALRAKAELKIGLRPPVRRGILRSGFDQLPRARAGEQWLQGPGSKPAFRAAASRTRPAHHRP